MLSPVGKELEYCSLGIWDYHHCGCHCQFGDHRGGVFVCCSNIVWLICFKYTLNHAAVHVHAHTPALYKICQQNFHQNR